MNTNIYKNKIEIFKYINTPTEGFFPGLIEGYFIWVETEYHFEYDDNGFKVIGNKFKWKNSIDYGSTKMVDHFISSYKFISIDTDYSYILFLRR